MEESIDIVGLDCKKEGDKVVCNITPKNDGGKSIAVDEVEMEGFSDSGGLPSEEEYKEPVSCRIDKNDNVVKLICSK